MPLFKRKDKTTIAELEEYYANQSKNRSSKAWLMALLSLFITIAVLAALFFGGRWLYRILTNDDSVVVTTTGEQQGGVPSFGEIRTEEDADSASDTNQDSVSDSDTATNNDATAGSQGVVSDEAATTTRGVAGSNTDSNTDSSTDNETIVSTTEIPDTGANEVIALLPLIALVSGYFYSRNRQLNK